LIATVVAGCAVGFPEEPSNVSASGVTLNSRIYTSLGGELTYWFRYGTSTAYGNETPHRTVDLAADSSRAVSEPIPITAGTEYHWQVCTQDGEEQPPRTLCSKDQSLYVGPVSCAPITRNTWVTNDLANCAPSIGADGISLHLQGHTFGGAIANNGFDGVTIEGGSAGGVLLTDARDNRVSDMHLSPPPGSTENALRVLGDSDGTLIADNTAFALGIALNVNASGVRAIRNTVSGAGETITDKQGPLLVLGNDNLIEGNTATHDTVGFARGVGKASIIVRGDRNRLVGNIANDGLVQGILIEGSAEGTVLLGNTASNNGHEFSFGNGITIEGTGTSTSLGDNVANDNEQLGISAPAGVTDLGGNRASGNGTAAQCTGVVCQP
jgi:parallel beta-helix repeat protein